MSASANDRSSTISLVSDRNGCIDKVGNEIYGYAIFVAMRIAVDLENIV